MDTANNLDKSKYEITIRTLFHSGDMSELLDKDVAYISAFHIRNRIIRKLVSGWIQYLMPPSLVYRWLFRGDYDVEAAFMEAFPTKILAGSTNKTAKKYAWVHTDVSVYERQDRLFRSLESQRACYQKFDGICCVSEGVKMSFIRKFGLREKVFVLYNILDEHGIEEKKNQPCIGYRKEGFTIISIGKLAPVKGFRRLIELCGRLREERFAFHLLILGDGPLEEELRELIRIRGLEPYVSLLGFRKNPYPYLAQADLYVCASYGEGFSTAVTEAVVLGIPVVTTDCAGMREILGESEYGYITDNTDRALYAGIKRMLSDSGFYRHYRQKVRERSRFFSMKERIRAYERLLDQ